MDMKAPLEVLPSNHLVNWGQGRMLDLPKLRSSSSRESGVKKINSGSISAQISPDILSFDLFTEQFPVAYLSLPTIHVYSSPVPSS